MKINVAERMQIDVDHIARVEGHGNIHIGIENGELSECSWEVVETPRFFEVMFRGLSVEMAPLLAARICGICSISHALASARALERALGVQAPQQAQEVRLLAKHAETLQSHTLHLFFLVAPDLLGVGSVIPILGSHPEVVQMALELRGYANRASDLLAGRTSHPMAIQIGGMSKLPRKSQLRPLLAELEALLPTLWSALDLFKTLPLPDFERETEFVSLRGDGDYPFIGGDLLSSDGIQRSEDDYRAMTNEYVVDSSTSKFCRLSRDSFAVGALARFNNNYEGLHPQAKAVAEALELAPPSYNPFHHNLAQLVECFHVAYESQELIAALLDSDLSAPPLASYEAKAGSGVGAIEAPRGILYHFYETDADGRIRRSDCVIPTGQNHANIEYDLQAFVPQLAASGLGEAQISKQAQMLVRAYDPCISCSVH
ncbi:MAG: Ni/Fe hydrogenase subunit alpha [Candidatus Promineifilaceae bacterium]|nr:Ni/Fe hydrogenase subunit alpha [Candidatus Promineifilaceae bacterium]